MPLTLAIARVGREREVMLRTLCQHYVHDMSEWFGNDVQPDGSFAYDMERWWTQRDVYLASAAGVPVGFAVVGPAGHWTGDPASHEVAEFFVLRKYRGRGAGRSLARLVWDQYPGEWLVRVLEANLPAVPFWRKAVATLSDLHREERLVIADRAWRFFRFNRD